MSPHCLYCTICDEEFDLQENWLNHLLRRNHQNLARVKSLEWGREERECVIVVFSTCSMEEGESLLEHFSKDVGTIVTDFVWWPERPNMGLMQFESSRKVEEVLSRHGRPELQLSDCFVQLKKAVDYLDLEWYGLIGRRGTGIDNVKDGAFAINQAAADLSGSKRPKDGDNGGSRVQLQIEEDEIILDSETSSFNSDDSDRREQEPELSRESDVEECNETDVICDSDIGDDNEKSSHDHYANSNIKCVSVSEFWEFCKCVEIPDDEYNDYLTVIDKIRQIVGDEHEVVMYRNWYLKLRNPGKDMFQLFMYTKENHKNPDEFLRASQDWGKHLLRNEESRNILSGFNRKCYVLKHPSAALYVHSETSFHFTITTDPRIILETQLNRLVSYLCTFDQRVKPLLCLIFGFANANQIYFARDYIPRSIPDPAALEWLVILFLCKSGILPTPREIQERPHKPLVRGKTDIGFSDDPEFVEEWKSKSPKVWKHPPENKSKEFMLSVLTLARDFFKLCTSQLNAGAWILNTRDAVIHPRHDLLTLQSTRFRKAKLSVKEKNKIRKVCSTGYRIQMLHPLDFSWKLSFENNTFSTKTIDLMNGAVRRLTRFLKKPEYNYNGYCNFKGIILGHAGNGKHETVRMCLNRERQRRIVQHKLTSRATGKKFKERLDLKRDKKRKAQKRTTLESGPAATVKSNKKRKASQRNPPTEKVKKRRKKRRKSVIR